MCYDILYWEFCINLPSNVSYNNTKLKSGEQLLDGMRFVAVLHSIPNDALSSLSSSISNFDLNSLFKIVSNVCSTDFTAYDFEIHKGGFQQMIKNNNASLKIPIIETEKVGDRNRLTEKSKSECLEAFKKD